MAMRTLLVCLAITALLALTAGVALAKKIQAPDIPEDAAWARGRHDARPRVPGRPPRPRPPHLPRPA